MRIEQPGPTAFTQLTDVPHTFLGASLKTVSVNLAETALEFTAGGGGGGTPGGSNTQVQFNDGGSFGGDAGLTYDKTTDLLTVNGAVHTSTVQAHTSAGLTLETQGGADIALFGAGGGQNATFYDGVKLNAQTASRILSTDASSNITALDTATYPSLTELAYVKGVTSAIQTQIGNKQDTLVSGTNIKTVNGNSLLGSGDLVVSGSTFITETEIDFGSLPTDTVTVTVTDASITAASKIMITPSGNTATGRVGNDYTWENFTFSAVAAAGSFILSAVCGNGTVVGKRKVFYSYS